MIEIHVFTSADNANILSDYFQEEGALAITLKDGGDEPIYEPDPLTPQLWHETIVIALFENTIPSHIHTYLKKHLQNYTIINTPQKDWVRESLDAFKPLQFGKRLWIVPSWHTPPDVKAVNVMLDPGLAFGTGNHETTTLCLKWLDKNIKPGMSVIDYGCGSGILALAAAKLGASTVYAIDNDPQALMATKNNAVNNNLGAIIQIDSPMNNPLENHCADIVIANILAKPLLELAPTLQKYVKIGGKIALSGILKDQSKVVIDAYNPWFNIENSATHGEWAILTGARK